MPHITAVAIVLFAALCSPASAARIVALCVFTKSTDNLTKYVQANEFAFDDETQSLDMRVKNSSANWLFVTQKTEFLDDTFSVKIDDNGTVAAVGLRNSVPVAFRLDPDGSLDFSYITPDKPENIHFECVRDD